jgi:putative acetyltransferase
VRSSELHDRESIISVVRDAFTSGGRDGNEEVAIVRSTWSTRTGIEQFDLVAVEGPRVLGHVLGAFGQLADRAVVGVAPLSVVPARQGEAIGAALMTELLGRVERAGEPLVVLLGFPEYYMRFGFEPLGPLQISYPPVGAGNPHFLVRRFAGYVSTYRGEFTYSWENSKELWR